MFAPHIEEGAKPASTKQGLHLQRETSLYDEELIHHDIDIVDLEASEEQENLERILGHTQIFLLFHALKPICYFSEAN